MPVSVCTIPIRCTRHRGSRICKDSGLTVRDWGFETGVWGSGCVYVCVWQCATPVRCTRHSGSKICKDSRFRLYPCEPPPFDAPGTAAPKSGDREAFRITDGEPFTKVRTIRCLCTRHEGSRICKGSGLRIQVVGVNEPLSMREAQRLESLERSRVCVSGSRVQGPGFRVKGAGCRVQGAGFRVQGPGSRVKGPGGRATLAGATTAAVLAFLNTGSCV